MDERLDVCVAERSTHSGHCASNSNIAWVRVAQGHGISELAGRCRGVRNHNSAVDSVSAGRRVQVLPCPPRPVDLSMVEEEVGVAR